MAYASQTDVVNTIGAKVLISISDDDRDNVADATVVSKALDDASSMADTYLAAYLPITTVPDMLRRAVVSIAVEFIREPRDKSTEDSRLAFKTAMDWLRDIGKGTAQLFPPTPGDVIDPGDPELEAEDRQWTRSTAAGAF